MNDEKQKTMSGRNSAKEKLSLSIPVETVKKLEEIVYRAGRDIPRDKAKRLTKSKLTELVLKALIYEYENGNGIGVIENIIFNWVEG